jgi:hypothetical protein
MLRENQPLFKTSWGKVFDELKIKLNLQTDVELASFLEVTKAFVSTVRAGRRNISVAMAKLIFAKLEREMSPDEYSMLMPVRITTQIQVRGANQNLQKLALKRANGICEYCASPAPFKTPQGQPYLEVHHLLPLASGGKDDAKNMAALCPNCHRRMHINPPDDALTFLETQETIRMRKVGKA